MSTSSSSAPITRVLGAVLLLATFALAAYAAYVARASRHQAGGPNSAPLGATAPRSAAQAGGSAAAVQPDGENGDVNALAAGEGGRGGMTALMAAAFESDLTRVKALLARGAKTEIRSTDGRTALIFAAGWATPELVSALLEAGARVDARANDGWTALMFAAARGEVGSVRALVAAGADVNSTNKWRQTALMAAARAGSIDKCAALLEAGALPATADSDGHTALSIAATTDAQPAVLELLARAGSPVDAPDRDGVTPLMKAAERGDLAQVKALLALGADRTLKDKANGWTAKEWAEKRDDDDGRAVAAALEK